jgi:hypothetical protein
VRRVCSSFPPPPGMGEGAGTQYPRVGARSLIRGLSPEVRPVRQRVSRQAVLGTVPCLLVRGQSPPPRNGEPLVFPSQRINDLYERTTSDPVLSTNANTSCSVRVRVLQGMVRSIGLPIPVD